MKNIGDLQRMLKTAKEMQDKLQTEMDEMRIEGTSGGGMVAVTLDGRKNVRSIRLNPEVVDKNDIDMLQDLILAACHDAGAKVDEALSEKLGGFGAGLKIPGLF